MSKFFTSDLHLGHKNIVDYCDRPFRKIDGQVDVEYMDRQLAANWDSVVKPGDTVYVLGDVSFDAQRAYDWMVQRPGQKFLVWGNHDPKPKDRKGRELLSRAFVKTADIMEAKLDDGTKVVMCHYPMLRWNRGHFGSVMLHGHCHGELHYPDESMLIADVGVDPWDFMPVSEAQLRIRLAGKGPTKHHYYQLREGADYKGESE